MLRFLEGVVRRFRPAAPTSPRPADPNAELLALERTLASPTVESKAHLYNRAGDLHARTGNRARALQSYGQAIDYYLETGYFDAAAAMCRKVIDFEPTVVRARCTLAFLSLGKGLVDDAEHEIEEYVRAARTAGQEALAVERIRLMAEATDDQEIRLILGEHLVDLGDPLTANEIFGSVYAERNALRPPPPPAEDAQERLARLLRTAITTPEPEMADFGAGLDEK